MSPWPVSRRRVAAAALGAGILTAAGAAAWGGEAWHVSYALLYVVLTAGTILSPAALTLQVLSGQVLAASLLLEPGAPSLLLLAPLVAGVVLTAELLGVAARMDAPAPRDPAPDLRRAGGSVLLGIGMYAAVGAAAGAIAMPAGLLAIVLGAAASMLLAVMIVREAR